MNKLSVFLIAIVVIVVDRITKSIAQARLPLDIKSVTLIPNILYFTRTSNTGSAFGLFPGSTAILAGIAGLCTVAVIIYVLRQKSKLPALLAIGLALPLGGAAGNFYDRAFHGFVVDFIDFWFGKYEWPVFNVADSCICIGVALIAIYTLRAESDAAKAITSSQSTLVHKEQSLPNRE